MPQIENVIDCYYETDDALRKNNLLKSILKEIRYSKINPKAPDDFKLILFPKL